MVRYCFTSFSIFVSYTDVIYIHSSSTFCRYGHAYHNLQSRVTRTLLNALLDPTKTLPQHYGAIQGLAAFGPSVVICKSLSLVDIVDNY